MIKVTGVLNTYPHSQVVGAWPENEASPTLLLTNTNLETLQLKQFT